MTTHIEDDKKAFQTMPKPPRIPKREQRQLSRFEIWAWSPITSFQVGLTAGYIALIYFGISSLIASPPSFQDTSPEGYAWFWALGLFFGAIIASLGSVSRNKYFEWAETVGASILSLTVGSYALLVLVIAYGLGDTGRIAGGAGFTALAVPILIRTMWLFSQLLRK